MKFYRQDNFIEDRNYAWQYFTTHAEQRLKTFNFYIVIMTLLLGTLFTLIKLEYTLLIILMAALMSFFSFIFWKLDQRNRELIDHAQIALKRLEQNNRVKLFINEEKNTNIKKANNKQSLFKQHFSYSDCFNWVFKIFGIGGILIIVITLLYEFILFTKKNTLNSILTSYNYIYTSFYTYESIIVLTILLIISWTFLHFFYSKHNHIKNLIFAFIFSIVTTSGIHIFSFNKLLDVKVDKVNISYKPTPQEPNIELKMLDKVILYFDKGEITVHKNLSKTNIFSIEHSSNLQKINNLVLSLNKSNMYYIKISAFASLERVVYFNKIVDNYQISIARANSTKEYILNLLINKKFPIIHVKFDVFGTSNQTIKDTHHNANRKAEIEVYLIK